jgi:hypothetical protein
LAALGVGGCRRAAEGSPADAVRIGRLGLIYGIYTGQHDGRPPASIEELRNFDRTRVNAEELSALGVATADELFISPRDGQSYGLIALGRLPPPVAGQPAPVVIYEQTGKDGTRLVARLGGATEEVDEQRFGELVPNPK